MISINQIGKLKPFSTVCAFIIILMSCSDDDNPIVSGLSNPSAQVNSSSTDLTVSFDVNQSASIQIYVLTRFGELSHSIDSEEEIPVGRHHYHIDISEDAVGNYSVQINTSVDTVQVGYSKPI